MSDSSHSYWFWGMCGGYTHPFTPERKRRLPWISPQQWRKLHSQSCVARSPPFLPPAIRTTDRSHYNDKSHNRYWTPSAALLSSTSCAANILKSCVLQTNKQKTPQQIQVRNCPLRETLQARPCKTFKQVAPETAVTTVTAVNGISMAGVQESRAPESFSRQAQRILKWILI